MTKLWIVTLVVAVAPCFAQATAKGERCKHSLKPFNRESIADEPMSLRQLAEMHGIHHVMLRFTQAELLGRVKNFGMYGKTVQHAELIPLFDHNGARMVPDILSRGYSAYNSGKLIVRPENWMIGLIFDTSILDRGDVVVSPHFTSPDRHGRQIAEKARGPRYAGKSMDWVEPGNAGSVEPSFEDLGNILAQATELSGSPAIGVYFDLVDSLDLSLAVGVWIPEPVPSVVIEKNLAILGVSPQAMRLHIDDEIPPAAQFGDAHVTYKVPNLQPEN